MQRTAARLVFFNVKAFEKLQHFGNDNATAVANSPDCSNPCPGRQYLMRDIQRHHDDGNTTFEDDFRCVWVNEDIELRRGRDVAALETAAAHQDDFSNFPRDIRSAN